MSIVLVVVMAASVLGVLGITVAAIVVVVRVVEKAVGEQTGLAVRTVGEVVAETVERTAAALGQMATGVVGEVKGGTGEVEDRPETEAERPPFELWGLHDEDFADPTDGVLADPPPIDNASRAVSVPPGTPPLSIRE